MSQGENGHFQLGLFSSWSLSCDERTIQVSSREQRLITALAIHGARSRIYLAGLLWPESPEPRAQANLRVSVHLITRNVPGLLVNQGTVLALAASVGIDLHQLQEQVLTIAAGERDELSLAYVDNLRRAELLPGWYDDWVLFERARLSHLRLHALQIIARNSLATHDNELALEAAAAALEIEPLYESAVEISILAERALGNNACAMRTYKTYETYLRENTGAEPSAKLRKAIADLF